MVPCDGVVLAAPNRERLSAAWGMASGVRELRVD